MYRALLALSLTACGSPVPADWQVAPELVSSTLEYVDLTGASPIPLTVSYAPLPDPLNGICVVQGTAGAIYLSPAILDIGPWQQKAILFHELTHCLYMDPTHSEDPRALMYPESLEAGDEAEEYWKANLYRLTLEAVAR